MLLLALLLVLPSLGPQGLLSSVLLLHSLLPASCSDVASIVAASTASEGYLLYIIFLRARKTSRFPDKHDRFSGGCRAGVPLLPLVLLLLSALLLLLLLLAVAVAAAIAAGAGAEAA